MAKFYVFAIIFYQHLQSLQIITIIGVIKFYFIFQSPHDNVIILWHGHVQEFFRGKNIGGDKIWNSWHGD